MDPNQFKLALLQAYPLGTMEVETPDGVGKLIGLRRREIAGDYVIATADVLNGGISNTYLIKDVTPRLRSFRSLTTKLADGTVAALEVAKLIWPQYNPTRVEDRGEKGLHVWGQKLGEVEKRFVYLYENDFARHLTAAASDYLRRNLFAVPLCGQPLQEGTDYIAKED